MNNIAYFGSWSEVFAMSLRGLWVQFIDFLPELIGALIVLILGLLASSILGKFARRLVRFARLDDLTEKAGIAKMFSDAGIQWSFSGLIGWVVKWFFIVVVLMAAANILGWGQVTEFLNDVAFYIPNIFIAVIIFGVGLVLSHFAHSAISKSAAASREFSENQAMALAGFGRWAIIVFTLLASLSQLGVATRLIEILFIGIVAALALAFGLGGRDKAAKILDKLDRG